MNDSAEKSADAINKLLPNIKVGTLRFFGVWFGRPYDNWHRVVRADAKDNVLTITFNEGETLEITDPTAYTYSSNQFDIRKAHKVVWKWHSYGMPKTDANLYYYEFEANDSAVTMMTNVNWFTEEQVPQFEEPAVKMY